MLLILAKSRDTSSKAYSEAHELVQTRQLSIHQGGRLACAAVDMLSRDERSEQE